MANETQRITFSDLERLAETEAPDFVGALTAFLAQEAAAEAGAKSDAGAAAGEASPTFGLEAFEGATRTAKAKRNRAKRSAEAAAAWGRFLGQPPAAVPARFRIGALLVAMYERPTTASREALFAVLGAVPLRYGVWGGVKQIYKRAEARLDAETFGILARRFDAGRAEGDVSRGTMLYLRRRAWRFLRELGRGVPELYPQFAAEVLRRYPASTDFRATWVANHIWAHGAKHYDAREFHRGVPADLTKDKAFAEAWQRAPDVLMYLLETCEADTPARFAIENLRKDFPERLRAPTPAWLARLTARPLPSAHEFVVDTLRASPTFHQGQLRELGLHDAVLALLTSASKKARDYAVEYAHGHASDLPSERLVALLEGCSHKETVAFALAALEGRAPREVGFALFGRLLGVAAANKWAASTLDDRFDRKEIPTAFLVEMLFAGHAEQNQWAREYFKQKYRPAELGVPFWVALLDDERAKTHDKATEFALAQLGAFPLSEMDAGWLIAAITREHLGRQVGSWLMKAESLPGLDVEKVKGLVFNPAYRDVALSVLGNRKLVNPRSLGLPWLLAVARRSDPSLHEFAHRYLLEHMKPADFTDQGGEAAGIARLFALALGKQEPEAVRVFAQTYLRCHHPVLGPEQPESKQLSLSPQLARSAYDPALLWPALFDDRADVRRFALDVAKVDLRAWNRLGDVYELTDAEAKEVRLLAYDAMLKAGEPAADPARTLAPEELDAVAIFALTEARAKATREVAMEVIRKHYERLGGSGRLAWLMQSPDREVRLFAIGLLWERHRPRGYPPGWRFAKKSEGSPATGEGGAFAELEALRGLLRRTLFGLPPGRAADEAEAKTRRRPPAGVVKRYVVELVRDFGVADPSFAHFAAPVLGEFTGSLAKGEWQSCLAALASLRRAHPGLDLGGVL